ncbi:MAG TPA: GNAT family N-acetyltransferase [Patescibacteria group bacterium]
MDIRRATIEDKEEIVRLMDEFNNYYYEENIFSEDFIPFWEYKDKMATFEEAADEWLSHSKFIMYAAFENGKMVGYICGEVKDRKVRVMDKEGYINDWFVSKNFRNKGVGMALYKRLVEDFKNAGCNRLGLLSNVNNKNTIAFYHKLGFIDDSVNMVKKID